MRVAFYAPLKAMDHPSPSGDRRMARAFADLLSGLGHEVDVACRLRTFDRAGDMGRQERLGELGHACAEAYLRRIQRGDRPHPHLWFTYHAYHKAPDWLGPKIAAALRIPYVVAEASVATKQENGPWQLGHAGTLSGLVGASCLLAMTQVDLAGLNAAFPDVPVVHFPPFLDTAAYGQPIARREIAWLYGLDAAKPWVITVAMMREDVKLQSYRLLGETLRHLEDRDFEHVVVGDGVARSEVERILSAARPGVRFLGHRSPSDLARLSIAADLMLWPALREAYGMALLEAQAAALPVVACREGGVSDIVAHGETGFLVEGRSAPALAEGVRCLLDERDLGERFATSARERARALHDVSVASRRLEEILREHAACA